MLKELRVRVGIDQKAHRIIERDLMATWDTSIKKAQTLGVYTHVTLGRKVP
ncbi:MAG: hypothetical protein JXB62_21250 [Pirellulales bacterium]|nr:hypothetical protein [Pirellulales bacterium]